jgi:hypothetical protein
MLPIQRLTLRVISIHDRNLGKAGNQHEFSLWDKVIPEVEWGVLVSATETSNTVVLEGANGLFRSIVAMDTRMY